MGSLLLVIPAAFVYGLFGVFCLLLLRIQVRIGSIALFTVSGFVSGFITFLLFVWIVGDSNGKLPGSGQAEALYYTVVFISIAVSLTSAIVFAKYNKHQQSNELGMSKKRIKVSVILILTLSIVPCVNRTVKQTRTAHSLIIFATLEREDITFNPYDKNGYFINQELAIWILKTFEYPYCSEFSEVEEVCGTSLISWVGRGLDRHGEESQKRGYELLDYFILRKEPLNSLNNGMTPIHEAILNRNAKYLGVLLSANADPNIGISIPEKEYDGLDAYQYLEYLEGKGKADFSEVRRVLVR